MLFLPLQVQIKHTFKEHIDQLTIQSNVVKGQNGWFGAVPLDGNVHIAVLSLNVILLCGAHTAHHVTSYLHRITVNKIVLFQAKTMLYSKMSLTY